MGGTEEKKEKGREPINMAGTWVNRNSQGTLRAGESGVWICGLEGVMEPYLTVCSVFSEICCTHRHLVWVMISVGNQRHGAVSPNWSEARESGMRNRCILRTNSAEAGTQSPVWWGKTQAPFPIRLLGKRSEKKGQRFPPHREWGWSYLFNLKGQDPWYLVYEWMNEWMINYG